MSLSATCACIGPQNGEPLCPCQMRAARSYLDRPPPRLQDLMTRPHGCVCPAGAEATCQGFGCPRKPVSLGWAGQGANMQALKYVQGLQ